MRMPGQVLEKVKPDLDAGRYDVTAGEPAGRAPEEALEPDQAREQQERPPDRGTVAIDRRHRINQKSHPVLHGGCTAGGADDQEEQGSELPAAPNDIVPDEGKCAGRKGWAILAVRSAIMRSGEGLACHAASSRSGARLGASTSSSKMACCLEFLG